MIEGSVRSYWDKLKVLDLATRVNGVNEIRNQLVVGAEVVADGVIQAGIEQDLERTRAIEASDKIEVTVDNGVVLLRGTVHFPREKIAAQNIAAW